MGFNSAFKGLRDTHAIDIYCPVLGEMQRRSTPYNAVWQFGL
jgi:hypothetical protein